MTEPHPAPGDHTRQMQAADDARAFEKARRDWAAARGGRTRDVREEIARALAEHVDTMTDLRDGAATLGCTCGWVGGRFTAAEFADRHGRVTHREHRADAVLAVPAIADALAAVERVRALAEKWTGRAAESNGWSLVFRGDLRRALDGEST